MFESTLRSGFLYPGVLNDGFNGVTTDKRYHNNYLSAVILLDT